MVKLNKIYTRTGDDGTTGLGDGSRVPKTDARVEAYGTVDEANAFIGVAREQLDGCDHPARDAIAELLGRIQNDLFDLGADLCCPIRPDEGQKLRVTAKQTATLEQAIDEYNERLQPLDSFVLPGGSGAASALHVARTVARRAERLVAALIAEEADTTNPETLRYLNRLSDLLFVLGRVANDDGRSDVKWVPGGA